MTEFNPDGSIKLPERVIRIREERKTKLQRERCILIKKEIVSDRTPKKCNLHIKLSEKFTDNIFIENIYRYFSTNSEVPSKLIKLNPKEFCVEIGTCFSRCRDCTSLVNRYREHLDGNLIEEKGSCSFEGRKRSFSYEDYFE